MHTYAKLLILCAFIVAVLSARSQKVKAPLSAPSMSSYAQKRARELKMFITQRGLTTFDEFHRVTGGDFVEWKHLQDLGLKASVEDISKFLV
jgi:hypothetical protein